MIKKFTLFIVSAIFLSSCGETTICNSGTVSKDTTYEDIKAKAKVLIISKIKDISCLGVQFDLTYKYPNSEMMVINGEVHCSAYDKTLGLDCKNETLSDWKAENSDIYTENIEDGNASCIIGGDAESN